MDKCYLLFQKNDDDKIKHKLGKCQKICQLPNLTLYNVLWIIMVLGKEKNIIKLKLIGLHITNIDIVWDVS